ncbi:10229_t:CDS:1, partial [Acaulospora morrowiae]
ELCPKRLENRTYPLDIPKLISESTFGIQDDKKDGSGVWIAIHASSSQRMLRPNDSTCSIIRFQCWSELPPLDLMKRNCGKIIGVAKFFACLKSEEVSDDNVWKGGDYEDGGGNRGRRKQQYCWMIDEVKALETPIECKGNVGIWYLDENIANQIWKEIEKSF